MIKLKTKAEELLAEDQACFRLGKIAEKSGTNLPRLSHHWEAFATSAQSVPQFHRLQEGVWQSLTGWPVTGPQKPLHSGRTGSSHSGTIWELQQCSPLEQSARGVLQNNSRCPSPMLTLAHPVQLVPREDYAGNASWTSHIHLDWWQAHMAPTICWWHWSYGWQQWWTSRPHQQTCRQNKDTWNGS